MGGWRACLLLSFFIQQGARLDARDYYDRTPFEAARDLWVIPRWSQCCSPLRLKSPALQSCAAADPHRASILRGGMSGKRLYRVGDNSLSYSDPGGVRREAFTKAHRQRQRQRQQQHAQQQQPAQAERSKRPAPGRRCPEPNGERGEQRVREGIQSREFDTGVPELS